MEMSSSDLMRRLDDLLSSMKSNQHLEDWTVEMVVDWMNGTNSKEWSSLFREQQVNGAMLTTLSLTDLANPPFNIPTLGKRIQLFHDILSIRSSGDVPLENSSSLQNTNKLAKALDNVPSSPKYDSKKTLEKLSLAREKRALRQFGTDMSSGPLKTSSNSLDQVCAQLVTKVSSLTVDPAPNLPPAPSEFTLGDYIETEQTMESLMVEPAWTPRRSSLAFSFQNSISSHRSSQSEKPPLGKPEFDSNITLSKPSWINQLLNHVKKPSGDVAISSPQVMFELKLEDKQGWAWVQSSLDQGWKRVWCVLRDGSIWLIKSPEDAFIVGCVPICQGYSLEPILDKSTKTSFAFKALHPTAREFSFCFDSQLDCVLWAKEVTKVVKGLSKIEVRKVNLF